MGLAVVRAEGSVGAAASRCFAGSDSLTWVPNLLRGLRIRGLHEQGVGSAWDFHQRLQPYLETLHFYC